MDYEIPFYKKNHKTIRHVIECSSVVFNAIFRPLIFYREKEHIAIQRPETLITQNFIWFNALYILLLCSVFNFSRGSCE